MVVTDHRIPALVDLPSNPKIATLHEVLKIVIKYKSGAHSLGYRVRRFHYCLVRVEAVHKLYVK